MSTRAQYMLTQFTGVVDKTFEDYRQNRDPATFHAHFPNEELSILTVPQQVGHAQQPPKLQFTPGFFLIIPKDACLPKPRRCWKKAKLPEMKSRDAWVQNGGSQVKHGSR